MNRTYSNYNLKVVHKSLKNEDVYYGMDYSKSNYMRNGSIKYFHYVNFRTAKVIKKGAIVIGMNPSYSTKNGIDRTNQKIISF